MPDRVQTKSVRSSSRRAMEMPRSAIREIMALAAGRDDVIHLEVGEPDVSTPSFIIDAAFAAAKNGWTKYSSNAGLPSLRGMIAERVSRRTKIAIAADRIVVTTGAIGALYSALLSIVDAGDEVLVPDPGWPNYGAITHLAGAAPVYFSQSAARGFLPDPVEIERSITPRTKAIIINTPCNPTGAVFPSDLMERIVDVSRRTGIYVVSDEIYEDLVFEGSHVSAGTFGADDRTFVISGFSKSYAMTGWRLGWVVCPTSLAATAASLQEPVTSCASTIAQKAGEKALSGDQTCVRDFRTMFMRRRDIVVDEFGNTQLLPMIPAGAFYALIDIRATGMSSLTFAKALLAAHKVAVVPGITFGPGGDGYVRIAFTIGDDPLREGLERLRNFIVS
jgi:aspartate/methionine/tyrosine aminotransferase